MSGTENGPSAMLADNSAYQPQESSLATKQQKGNTPRTSGRQASQSSLAADAAGGAVREQKTKSRSFAQTVKKISYAKDYASVPFGPTSEFFKLLSRRPTGSKAEQRSREGRLKLFIPDTVIFEGNRNASWFYSSPDGYIYRTDNFTEQDVLKKLGNEDSETAVAAIMKQPHVYHPASANQISLLDTKDLKMVLANPAQGRYMVQKFVKCKGRSAFIVRAFWSRTKPCGAWTIANQRTFYDDSEADFRWRYCTNVEKEGSTIIAKMSGPAAKELKDQNESIVRFVENMVAPRVQFEELVVDYIKDDHGRWWALQIKAFTLSPESHAKFARLKGPDTEVRVKEPHEKPKQPKDYARLVQCKCCHTRYPVTELQYELTRKMIEGMITHLRRRGITLSWFPHPGASVGGGRVGSDAADVSKAYQAVKVCRSCYDLFATETRLISLEREFARELGIPMQGSSAEPVGFREPGSIPMVGRAPSSLGTAPNSWKFPSGSGKGKESMSVSQPTERLTPPAQLQQYRLIVFLQDLRDVPDMQHVFSITDSYYLTYTVFGHTVKVPVNLRTGGRRSEGSSTLPRLQPQSRAGTAVAGSSAGSVRGTPRGATTNNPLPGSPPGSPIPAGDGGGATPRGDEPNSSSPSSSGSGGEGSDADGGDMDLDAPIEEGDLRADEGTQQEQQPREPQDFPIHHLRGFYFFASQKGFHQFLSATEKIEVVLHSVRTREVLGRARIALKQFSSGLIDRLERVQLFDSPHLEMCGLKTIIGFVPGPTTTTRDHMLSHHSGVWVPPDGFYTCDPLPAEWLAALPARGESNAGRSRHQRTIHSHSRLARGPMGSGMEPGRSGAETPLSTTFNQTHSTEWGLGTTSHGAARGGVHGIPPPGTMAGLGETTLDLSALHGGEDGARVWRVTFGVERVKGVPFVANTRYLVQTTLFGRHVKTPRTMAHAADHGLLFESEHTMHLRGTTEQLMAYAENPEASLLEISLRSKSSETRATPHGTGSLDIAGAIKAAISDGNGAAPSQIELELTMAVPGDSRDIAPATLEVVLEICEEIDGIISRNGTSIPFADVTRTLPSGLSLITPRVI